MWRGTCLCLAVLLGAGCSVVNDYPQVREAGTAEELTSALSASASGDYVRVTGVISGGFLVPAGVTLLGSTFSQLEVPPGVVGLTLQGSSDPDQPTTIRDLVIVSEGRAGLLARGGFHLVQSVEVRASGGGVAAYFEDSDRVELRSVTLVGDQPQGIFRTRTESSGLVLLRVADARLTDVTADAFGRASAALVESTVTWEGGSTSRAGQIGLAVHTSSVSLRDLDASGTRGLDAIAGVVISGDSHVRAERLSASLSANFGLVQFGGEARYTGLSAQANGGIGVVLQDVASAEIEVLAERNFAVGLLAVDVARLRITNSLFREHARSEVVLPVGLFGFGDGAQLVRSFADFRMSDCEIDKSYRIALLLVPEGQRLEGAMFEDVRITGFDDQLGAIRRGGEQSEGWDDGLLRSPTLLANDAAQQGSLPFFDRLDRTALTAVGESIAERGLEAVAAP